MFIDAQNQLSAAQAVTASANSTNVIDLGAGLRNFADGEPMCVLITVGVAADFTTGDETYRFDVVTDSATSLASSPVVVDTKTVVAGSLTLGSKVVIPLSPGIAYKQYLGLKYVTGGTTPTITCSAEVMPLSMVEKVRYYVDNSPIS